MEGPLDLLLQRPQLETFISFSSLPFKKQSSEYKLSASKSYKRSQCKLSSTTGKTEYLLAI